MRIALIADLVPHGLIHLLGEVAWRLAAGELTYYRWSITDVEYDRPARFRARGKE